MDHAPLQQVSVIPPLHVVTTDAIIARPGFVTHATAVLQAGGADVALHVRSRVTGGRAIVALVRRLLDASRTTGSMIVVNGRADVAMVTGAHGVQLGRGGLEAGDVRRIAPLLRIGVSAHPGDQLAYTPPPDWIIFGQVFESTTHPGIEGHGVDSLSRLARGAAIPVLAIGGVTPERVPLVQRAGGAGVAVVSGIWGADDPGEAVTRYLWAYVHDSGEAGGDDHRERRTPDGGRRHDTR